MSGGKDSAIICNYKQEPRRGTGSSWQGHSIVTRGRGRIGWGEWYAFTGFFGCAVVHSFLTRSSNSKDRECDEDRVPVLLTKVVSDVIHIPNGPWPPELGVELVSGFDEVTSCVRFVCPFDLI